MVVSRWSLVVGKKLSYKDLFFEGLMFGQYLFLSPKE